ncbi:Ger(x)C family spore germination protein [Paenibacillus timonensis]|uniref:Ger(X)C family spore germination protein n=1 Tax=Paenibacillus timonensis TaxID=225915 RepID=A0ABW3S9B4_9BACL|nr:Ger(x)C family spore germination protein [Paenibacillus timonensis]MCH1639568.1 Ger(x)C family spore germination protein [Paenibacillus timonensis]
MNLLPLLLKITLVACCTLALGGCWDNRDINHRSLPIVMGISREDSKYKVFLDIPQSSQDGTRSMLVTRTGQTITEVVDEISSNLESRVDLLHLKVIIFERKYAEEGLMDSISSFMRSREISAKAMVAICDEDLGTFFNKLQENSSTNQTVLYNFFEKNAGWSPSVAVTRTWEIFRSIHSYTRDIAIPIIKSGTSTVIENVGAAIIRNGRMVGRITEDETLLMNAFDEESAHGKIEVMNHASVLIVSNSTKHHVALKDGAPYMRSQINLKVSVLETRGDPSVDTIKDELEKLLTERFNKMFKSIQEHEADILGVGQYFRTKIPRDKLAHWRTDYLPRLKMDLEVKTTIQNEGNLKTVRDEHIR